ncbi:MAG: alpha-L-fucosidase [Proteobacteria bacterium]|nr:alpha-L-fucosidase [Pseudomonadota bacterium]
MFLHWGIYSVVGKHEWEMEHRGWKILDYEKLADRFNPVRFDPQEWVSVAKTAGMRYMVITTKHHDGFAMWDSKVSDYDIIDRTPYKRDVIKMLAIECQRQGIAFGLYHSHLDWHHLDYFPRGKTGHNAGRPNSGDFNKYIDYMNSQIAELASGEYGPVSSWWFDGVWDHKTGVDWRLKETYDLIHNALPHSMIGNNRFSVPEFGEDIQVFERDLPGHNTYGANIADVSPYPLESVDTMNGHWGYNAMDSNFKSVKALVHYLVRAAGLNGNLLLNVGPPPDGKFQPEVVQRLQGMGEWTSQKGHTLYKTRGGPMAEQKWGVMTHMHDGTRSYLHVLDPTGIAGQLQVPVTGNVTAVKLESTGAAVPFQAGQQLALTLAGIQFDPIDTIFVIEHQGKLKGIPKPKP